MYDIFMAFGVIIAIVACIVAIIPTVSRCTGEEMNKKDSKWCIIAGVICLVLAAGCFFGAHQTEPHCPNCGAFAYFSYCQQCGEAVNFEPTCPGCGAESDTPFCGSCGTPMNPES